MTDNRQIVRESEPLDRCGYCGQLRPANDLRRAFGIKVICGICEDAYGNHESESETEDGDDEE